MPEAVSCLVSHPIQSGATSSLTQRVTPQDLFLAVLPQDTVVTPRLNFKTPILLNGQTTGALLVSAYHLTHTTEARACMAHRYQLCI